MITEYGADTLAGSFYRIKSCCKIDFKRRQQLDRVGITQFPWPSKATSFKYATLLGFVLKILVKVNYKGV